jgi:hypothetical protein
MMTHWYLGIKPLLDHLFFGLVLLLACIRVFCCYLSRVSESLSVIRFEKVHSLGQAPWNIEFSFRFESFIIFKFFLNTNFCPASLCSYGPKSKENLLTKEGKEVWESKKIKISLITTTIKTDYIDEGDQSNSSEVSE